MAAVIGYANQIDQSTLAGGSWSNTNPLANLKTRYLKQKARSNNALAASTIITLDLTTPQRIGVLALVAHNLSEVATVRIQAASDSGFSTILFDSGASLVYRATDYASTFAITEARYWKISINDTTNPSGYVEIGRIFIGWKFKPEVNMDWAAGFSIESKTIVAEAIGGPEYFDERKNRRVWQGKWSWLTDYEAYSVLMTMQQMQDVSREVYVLEDDADVQYRKQRWFLGRFRQLSSIEWPYLDRHSTGIEIGELL